jgi:hypothetical protein
MKHFLVILLGVVMYLPSAFANDGKSATHRKDGEQAQATAHRQDKKHGHKSAQHRQDGEHSQAKDHRKDTTHAAKGVK